MSLVKSKAPETAAEDYESAKSILLAYLTYSRTAPDFETMLPAIDSAILRFYLAEGRLDSVYTFLDTPNVSARLEDFEKTLLEHQVIHDRGLNPRTKTNI